VDKPTEEERLGFVKSYGVEPVTDINTDLTFKDAAKTVAEFTPIIGDAMAAKEVYDELMKDEPNYGLIAALGGAALIGAVPGIGDAAAAGIRKAVDVAKRVEVDPDAVGMMGGNIRIKPKTAANQPNIISFTEKRKEKDLAKTYQDTSDKIKDRIKAKQNLAKKVGRSGLFGKYTVGSTVRGRNKKGDPLPFKILGHALDEIKMDTPSFKRLQDRIDGDLTIIEKNGKYYIPKLITSNEKGQKGSSYLDIVKSNNYPIMGKLEVVDAPRAAIKEGVPTIEAAGLTDEAIEKWRKENATSEEFRKALKGRNEVLQELASGVDEGRVFASTYRKRADEIRPIREVKEVPKPATNKEIVSALNDKQRRNPIVELNEKVSTGEMVDVRLNIPAYTDYDVWVPTIRHNGKEKYKAAVRLKNVNFIKPTLSGSAKRTDSSKALKVAKGGEKNPFAVMTGEYVEGADDELFTMAKEVFDSDEWTQVGYDPIKRGFFYDRETGEAILEAAEVIQVGHLVLARNAKKVGAEAFPFNEGGIAMEEQMAMNFGDVPDNTIGIDPVSGNDIPMGSTAENVRDDIPAMLSEGEIVIPADVVNYHGVKLFEDLRDEAKLGYSEMAEDGRIGGEPMEDDMEMENDIGLDLADLETMEVPDDEESVEMRRGGMNFEGGRGNIYKSYLAPKSSPRPKPRPQRFTVVQKAPDPFSSPTQSLKNSVSSSPSVSASPAQPSYTASSTTGSYKPSDLGITKIDRPTLNRKPPERDNVFPSIADQINFGGKGFELRQQDQAQREAAERRAEYNKRRAEANQPSFFQSAVQKAREMTGYNPFDREDNQENNQNNLFSSDRRGGQYPNIPEGTNLLEREGFIPRFKQGLANTFGYDEGGMATDDNLIGGEDQFNQPFYAEDQKGGFDMDMAYPDQVSGGTGEPMLEMREYMNDQGHRIFITFIDGEPQMEIPAGYYPVGEATTMQPVGSTGVIPTVNYGSVNYGASQNDDPGVEDMPMPEGINYKELTLAELQEMVEDQKSFGSKVFGSLSPITKIIMWDQTRRTKAELERRRDDPYTSEVDKRRYDTLLELANRDEPGLVATLLNKITGKETEALGRTPEQTSALYAQLDKMTKAYTPDAQTANDKTTPGVDNNRGFTPGVDGAISPAPPAATTTTPFIPQSSDADDFDKMQDRFDIERIEAEMKAQPRPAPKTATTPIRQASPRVQQARQNTQKVMQDMRDRGASREERTQALKAAARTENVLRDLDRGVVRGFEKGGLASKKKGRKKKSK
tara:strand:- start:29 stop:3835 length:3807 start_codon:yes stop_codon:yes gene_type:complete